MGCGVRGEVDGKWRKSKIVISENGRKADQRKVKF